MYELSHGTFAKRMADVRAVLRATSLTGRGARKLASQGE
jgi:hypothetical protein